MINDYDIKKLQELVQSENVIEIKKYMLDNNLILSDDGRIIPKDTSYYKEQAEYYDLEQYVRKIFLNSFYGFLLNNNGLVYDFRLGSSTTLTGRKVVQHLTSKANELMIGEYTVHGHCQTYNDTDSVYCSIGNDEFKQRHPEFVFDKDNIKEYADMIGDSINDSFPEYMKKMFHCSEEGANLQKAGREVVATKGLFVAKKRYSLMVYDKDGYRQDVNGKTGKMKTLGIQMNRSDTHPLVKELLKKMLNSVLTDGSKEKLVEIMRNFGNKDWGKLNAWDKGTPRTVNKLDFYTKEYNKSGKCSVGQVMASINWNRMLEMMGDKKSPKILDGDKVIVCKMKPNNPFGYKSIALPNTITRVPKWFKQLPFDEQSMVDSAIDKTIETVFGVIGWNLTLKDAMESSNEDLESILTFC